MEMSNLENKPTLTEEDNKEKFWQHHHAIQKESGLSKSQYCRANKLSYVRYGYWLRKWSSQPSHLLPVKLNLKESYSSSGTLCTLNLPNGLSLKIHDLQVLTFILEKFN